MDQNGKKNRGSETERTGRGVTGTPGLGRGFKRLGAGESGAPRGVA